MILKIKNKLSLMKLIDKKINKLLFLFIIFKFPENKCLNVR